MVNIRRIESEDLEELAELYLELTGENTDRKRMRKAYKEMEKDATYLVLGAWNEAGELVGSVYTRLCQDLVGECQYFLVVENVIVKGTARRQGIGKELLNYVKEYASSHNCSYSMLVSGAARKEAHQFYENAGYDGTVRGFRQYYYE